MLLCLHIILLLTVFILILISSQKLVWSTQFIFKKMFLKFLFIFETFSIEFKLIINAVVICLFDYINIVFVFVFFIYVFNHNNQLVPKALAVNVFIQSVSYIF